MLSDLFRNYKRIVLLILLLLCAIFFWFFACHDQNLNKSQPAMWEEETYGDDTGVRYRFSCGGLEGTVIFGAKGVIPPNQSSPVFIRVSSAENDFDGFVRITLPGDDGNGILYQSSFSCKKGKDLDWSMKVPQLGSASCFSFEIMDSYQTPLLSRVMVPDWARKENTNQIVYLGVLSDHVRRLSYLDGLMLGDDGAGCLLRLVEYRKEDFPVDSAELLSLGGLLIDDFDTSELSRDQLACLEEYIELGGDLLIGTGESGKETLSGIGQMTGLKDGKKKEEVLDFAGAISTASRLSLVQDYVSTAKNPAWSRINFSQARCGYERQLGEGKIYYTRFSFSDKTFSSWNNAGVASAGLLRYILEAAGFSFSEDQSMLRMWYLERTLYAFLTSLAPDTFYYGMFFLCYIAALILIGYYFLRKIQKRELIWFIVPLMSVGFVIFLFVHTSRISRPDTNSFSMLRIADNSKSRDECYLLYQNGNGDACQIDFSSDVETVEPLDYEYRLDIQEIPDVDTAKTNYRVNRKGGRCDILFSETIPGTSHLLRLDAKAHRDKSLEAEIHALPTTFYGTVQNSGKRNYSRVIAIRGRQYVILPGIDAGEVAAIDRRQVRCLSNYEEDEFSYVSTPDDESVLANVLMYIEKSWMKDSNRLNETILAGVTYDVDSEILTGGNGLKNQIALDVIHIPDPQEEENKKGKSPVDTITNINASCLRSDEEGMLIHDTLEANKTKATYQFDRNRELVGLCRNRDSFKGTIRAYNYRTGKDDVILKNWDDMLEGKALEDYLSDQNVMILTYRLPEDQDMGNTPVISAQMSEPLP